MYEVMHVMGQSSNGPYQLFSVRSLGGRGRTEDVRLILASFQLWNREGAIGRARWDGRVGEQKDRKDRLKYPLHSMNLSGCHWKGRRFFVSLWIKDKTERFPPLKFHPESFKFLVPTCLSCRLEFSALALPTGTRLKAKVVSWANEI